MLAAVHGYSFSHRENDSLETIVFNEIKQALHHKSFEEVRLLKNKYFNINLLHYERALQLPDNYKFHSTGIAIKKDFNRNYDYPSSFSVDLIRKGDEIIYYTLPDTDLNCG